MTNAKQKWRRGSFLLLDQALFQPASATVRVRFLNGDAFQLPCLALWQGRSETPVWPKLRVEPETRGGLLVPTQ